MDHLRKRFELLMKVSQAFSLTPIAMALLPAARLRIMIAQVDPKQNLAAISDSKITKRMNEFVAAMRKEGKADVICTSRSGG